MSQNFRMSYLKNVKDCKACTVREECREPVPGEGDFNSKLVFVGRNPGEEEDLQGHPFVGAAGKVLNRMLRLLELERENVFITNLYLCHSKLNRLPMREEAGMCIKKFLRPTLLDIKPKVVVTFGETTNYYLCGLKSITKHSAMLFDHNDGFTVVPSIHPAAVCYDPSKWAMLEKVIDSIKFALR